MKTKGWLHIIAESELENYALEKWSADNLDGPPDIQYTFYQPDVPQQTESKSDDK